MTATMTTMGRRTLILVVTGGFLVAAYTCLTLLVLPSAGTFHDDGIYLATTRALAEGRGYHIISMPGEPAQTKYPILLPFLLSIVWRAFPSFPANLPWLRLVPLGASILWLMLSYRLLKRIGARVEEAAIIVLLVALSPWTVFLSTTLLAETLFAASSTAMLLALPRALVPGSSDGGRSGIAGILAGLAFLARAAGIAGAAAGALVLVGRDWRRCTRYLIGLLVVTVPWFLWLLAHRTGSPEGYYTADNYASWNIVASYSWPEKFRVLFVNGVYIGTGIPFLWGLPAPIIAAIVPLVILVRGLWKSRRDSAAIFVALNLALVLAWVWAPPRFLVPLLPLILWFAYIGLGRRKMVAAVTAAVLAVSGSIRLIETGRAAPRLKASWVDVRAADDWVRTKQLLDWVAANTPARAVLTGNLDPAYYLYTGRHAVRAFVADPYALFYGGGSDVNPLGTVDDFRRRLIATHADYLIMTPSGGFSEAPFLERQVAELSSREPGALIAVAGDPASGYVVYRVDARRLRDRGEAVSSAEAESAADVR